MEQPGGNKIVWSYVTEEVIESTHIITQKEVDTALDYIKQVFGLPVDMVCNAVTLAELSAMYKLSNNQIFVMLQNQLKIHHKIRVDGEFIK